MALAQDAGVNKVCLDVGVMPTQRWICRHLLEKSKAQQHHCTSATRNRTYCEFNTSNITRDKVGFFRLHFCSL